MRGKVWSAVAATALGLAAGMPVTAGAASAQDGLETAQPVEQSVEFVVRRTVLTVPDVPTVGTTFIAGGDLFDSTDTTRVGEAFSQCMVVEVGTEVQPRFTASCSTVFRLIEGDLFLSSLREYSPGRAGFAGADVAVIGGTGEYATAQGDGTATRLDETPVAYRYVLNLSL